MGEEGGVSRRSLIAGQGSGTYVAGMLTPLLRLFLLAALALMPFGMAGASAATNSTEHAVSAGHCDDQQQQQPTDSPSAMKAHCAVCAALPVIETNPAVLELRPALLLVVEADRWIVERGPETDTPPPKLG